MRKAVILQTNQTDSRITTVSCEKSSIEQELDDYAKDIQELK